MQTRVPLLCCAAGALDGAAGPGVLMTCALHLLSNFIYEPPRVAWRAPGWLDVLEVRPRHPETSSHATVLLVTDLVTGSKGNVQKVETQCDGTVKLTTSSSMLEHWQLDHGRDLTTGAEPRHSNSTAHLSSRRQVLRFVCARGLMVYAAFCRGCPLRFAAHLACLLVVLLCRASCNCPASLQMPCIFHLQGSECLVVQRFRRPG